MKIKPSFLILLMLLAGSQAMRSQTVVQTIKGTVIDKDSKVTLPGATVYINGSNPVKGTVTDEHGNFRITGVETGRVGVCVRYLGYEPFCADNLSLTSGKEMVLNLAIEESVTTLDAVVVKAGDKTMPVNSMSVVSSRTFSIEETQRYAGARNDVARMAINYAGVSAGNDATNEIIIRGNTPNGLLWQLEGVEISNPNHFGFMGATGGPVGMLNNNTLRNSDFLTGAFAAEYGNAISGVFDLRMREGNHDKHEFLGQIGFNGFELGAEGPVSRKHNASYMINYRYSTLGFFHLLGINFGTGSAVPDYQDVSLKLVSDLGKGKVSLFSLAGNSSIELLYSEKDSSDMENLYENIGLDIYSKNRQGVIGLSYFRHVGKSYVDLTVAMDGLQNKSTIDTVYTPQGDTRLFEVTDFRNRNTSANLSFSTKFNAKLNTRIGAEVRRIDFTLRDSIYLSKYDAFFNEYKDEGHTTLSRAYAEFQYRFSPVLSVNAGVHAMSLALNHELNFEPRASVTFKPLAGQSFTVGYGNHSKIMPLFVYFRRLDLSATEYIQPNKELNMPRAHHFVATWDWQLSPNTRIKLEGYYQHLYNAVVEKKASTFSMLNNNSFQFAIPDTLTNGGTGDNKGIELTLERFMDKGFYYLVTTSVFDSKYKGSDGISRSTAFDGGYVVNALAGKEFLLPSKKESVKNYLSADIKVTAAGGQRYTPVDIEQSALKGRTIYNDALAYSEKFKDYFRLDLRIAYRHDNARFSQEYAFDIQNMTNHENPLYMQYNAKTGKTEFVNQLKIFPVMQYRIIF